MTPDVEQPPVDNSDLVAVYADKTSTPLARIRAVRVEMLKCRAQLEFQSLHSSYFTVDDARAVTRRFRQLKGLAGLELRQMRQEGPVGPGAAHPLVPQLLDHLLAKVVETAVEVLPADRAKAFEQGLREALADDPAIPWPPSDVE